jgi:competence protein ComEA
MNTLHKHAAAVLLAAFTLLALAAAPLAAADAKVNINTATVEQLQFLPRIGPAVAQRIVEHREANGPFKSVEDLMLVRGIGERSFESLKPHLAVSGDTTLAEKVRSPKKSAARTAEKP